MMPGMARPPADPRDPAFGPASGPDLSALPGSTTPAACRFLVDPDIGVRFARPERTHRCTAVRPPDAVAIEVQRSTCLTASHQTCAAFMSARARRATMLAASDVGRAADRDPGAAVARTTPLILAEGGRTIGLGRPVLGAQRTAGRALATAGRGTRAESRPADAERRRDAHRGEDSERSARPEAGSRRRGATPRPPVRGSSDGSGRRVSPAGLAVAVVVVLGALAVVAARLPGGPGTSPASSAPALAAATAVASPVVSPLASAPASTSASPAPTATLVVETPAPTPTIVAAHTYRVKAGDTLSAIAARFGVSVDAIQQLNGIADPRLLQIGQVLKIP